MSIGDFNQRKFIKEVRYFMKVNGLSVRKFAQLSGVAFATLYRLADGKSEITLSTIKKLEKAMTSKLVLLALLFCTSCASYDAARDCQKQAGDRPYPAAEFLSPFAVIAVNETDERQAYNRSVDACMGKWRAANP